MVSKLPLSLVKIWKSKSLILKRKIPNQEEGVIKEEKEERKKKELQDKSKKVLKDKNLNQENQESKENQDNKKRVEKIKKMPLKEKQEREVIEKDNNDLFILYLYLRDELEIKNKRRL